MKQAHLVIVMSRRKARAIIETLEGMGVASLAKEIKWSLRKLEKLDALPEFTFYTRYGKVPKPRKKK